MRILILDTETTGTDPEKDKLLEIAWAVWDTSVSTMLHCRSVLVMGNENPAFNVNGIHPDILVDGSDAYLLGQACVWCARGSQS